MNIWSQLMMYLQYPFVRYALIVGTLISLCASLLGVILVLKRFSYIGDGLSHTAFGAMSVASILHLTDGRMILVLPATIAAAVLLLKQDRRSSVSGDAKIAMVSVSSLAVGYLLMNRFNVSSNVSADVCSTLFGATSILTLTRSEVWLCVILSAVAVILYILLYNRIFAVTFDESFAASSGLNVNALNLLIAVIIAVIVVLAMNLVGSLLISALIIFPAISAMQICSSFRSVSITAAILSVCSSLAGMIASILADTPVGSTIVAAQLAVFIVIYCFRKTLRRNKADA